MPTTFIKKIKWINWKFILLGFQLKHPSCWGVSLNYICCDSAVAITLINVYFMDDYIDRDPLHGTSYVTYS